MKLEGDSKVGAEVVAGADDCAEEGLEAGFARYCAVCVHHSVGEPAQTFHKAGVYLKAAAEIESVKFPGSEPERGLSLNAGFHVDTAYNMSAHGASDREVALP